MYLGYARSSFYKKTISCQEKRENNDHLLYHVRQIRKEQPMLGVRKLHHILSHSRKMKTSLIGRDRLFALLRAHDMLIKRKVKYVITTDSNHPYKVHKNLILEKKIDRPNLVWVSDITYVKLSSGSNVFVSLVTDHYSRKIVGYNVSDSLRLEGSLKAIKKALKSGRPRIHHSDRGSQYCSYAYTGELKKYQVEISMTENGNCYENAIAERINGILKQEYNLSATFRDINQVKKTLDQAVRIYNTKRPHWSLGLKVPEEVHRAA